ncbi:hypothetical protein ACFFRR_010950 [Megaselia abdita]
MFRREFFVYFLVIIASVHGGLYDGCSLGFQGTDIPLRDLENNAPKSNELVRTKAFFETKPSFNIVKPNGEEEFYFGNFENFTTYAIYETRKDFLHNTNPIEVTRNVFGERYFTEVDFVLKKNGHFVIFIYGNDDFFLLSWKSGRNFANSSQITIQLYSEDKYLYDCPV